MRCPMHAVTVDRKVISGVNRSSTSPHMVTILTATTDLVLLESRVRARRRPAQPDCYTVQEDKVAVRTVEEAMRRLEKLIRRSRWQMSPISIINGLPPYLQHPPRSPGGRNASISSSHSTPSFSQGTPAHRHNPPAFLSLPPSLFVVSFVIKDHHVADDGMGGYLGYQGCNKTERRRNGKKKTHNQNLASVCVCVCVCRVIKRMAVLDPKGSSAVGHALSIMF